MANVENLQSKVNDIKEKIDDVVKLQSDLDDITNKMGDVGKLQSDVNDLIKKMDDIGKQPSDVKVENKSNDIGMLKSAVGDLRRKIQDVGKLQYSVDYIKKKLVDVGKLQSDMDEMKETIDEMKEKADTKDELTCVAAIEPSQYLEKGVIARMGRCCNVFKSSPHFDEDDCSYAGNGGMYGVGLVMQQKRSGQLRAKVWKSSFGVDGRHLLMEGTTNSDWDECHLSSMAVLYNGDNVYAEVECLDENPSVSSCHFSVYPICSFY